MYVPTIARFLQEDTYYGEIDDPLSLNLYTYCGNEPLMYWDPTGHARGDWWDFRYFGENLDEVVEFIKKSPEERQDIVWDIELPPDSTKNDKLGAKVGNIINKAGGAIDSGIAAANSVINSINTIKQAKTLGEKQAVAVGAGNAIIKTMLIEPSAAIKYWGDAWFVGKDYADSQYNRYMENAKGLEQRTNDLAIAKDSDRIDEMYNASSNITNIGIGLVSIVEGGIALKNGFNKLGSIRPSGNAPSLTTAGTNIPFKPSWLDDVVEQKGNVYQVKGKPGVSGKVKGKPEIFIRYGSEAEALASKEGLVPKVLNGKPTRDGKWISLKGKERSAKDLGEKKGSHSYEIRIEAKPGTKEWLESKGLKYEDMIGGEADNTGNVFLKPTTEPGSYGIGSDLLDEFNENWVINITTKKVGK